MTKLWQAIWISPESLHDWREIHFMTDALLRGIKRHLKRKQGLHLMQQARDRGLHIIVLLEPGYREDAPDVRIV